MNILKRCSFFPIGSFQECTYFHLIHLIIPASSLVDSNKVQMNINPAWDDPPPPGTEEEPVETEESFQLIPDQKTKHNVEIDIELLKVKDFANEKKIGRHKRSRSRSTHERHDRKRKTRSRSRHRHRKSRSRSRHRRRSRSRSRGKYSQKERRSRHGSRSRHSKKSRSRSRSKTRSHRSHKRSRRSRSYDYEQKRKDNHDIVDMKIEEEEDEEEEETEPIKENAFKNDGSFLEMFKKMQEEKEAEEQRKKEEETKKLAVPLFGKRKGGKVLKTGLVEKSKPTDAEIEAANDAWSVYMKEVKRYKEACCDDDSKTRPLVK